MLQTKVKIFIVFYIHELMENWGKPGAGRIICLALFREGYNPAASLDEPPLVLRIVTTVFSLVDNFIHGVMCKLSKERSYIPLWKKFNIVASLNTVAKMVQK